MMNFKNIYYSKTGRVCCGLAAALALTACSDWDDHYDVNTAVLESQKASLWENISNNTNLKQFASLVKKTGCDTLLNASHTYTVWAPLDNTFDYETLAAAGNAKVQKEFVLNHIARNNYPASGDLNGKRIYMLNEKQMTFDGNGTYTMQGIDLDQINLGSSNGIVHTLKGKIPFLQNIFESLDSNDVAIDSISKYFHRKDEHKFNPEKSVVGPMKDGEITYRDSVFDEHNDFYARYRAYIHREDSNYTMIVPTNEAWVKAKEKIESYFNYLPNFQYFDKNEEDNRLGSVYSSASINADYMKDSLVHLMLMRDLFYNNNLYGSNGNKKLNSLQTGETLKADSLVNTTSAKIYGDDAAALFEGAQKVEKSNGAIWITDSLRMRSWTTWNPEIILEAESNSLQASIISATGMTLTVTSNRNPEAVGRISKNRFLEAVPTSSNTNPQVSFYIPSVRSTTYSVYAVFVPGYILYEGYEPLPYRTVAYIGYADKNGRAQQTQLKNPADGSNYYYNDPTRVDTLYLGDFEFPTAYMGLATSDKPYYPYVTIRSFVSGSMGALYDRTLRIDCVIFRPKELDTYMKEHPGYKYDDGNY